MSGQPARLDKGIGALVQSLEICDKKARPTHQENLERKFDNFQMKLIEKAMFH